MPCMGNKWQSTYELKKNIVFPKGVVCWKISTSTGSMVQVKVISAILLQKDRTTQALEGGSSVKEMLLDTND